MPLRFLKDGFIFCTESFTPPSSQSDKGIVDLMNVLRIRYGIEDSFFSRRGATLHGIFPPTEWAYGRRLPTLAAGYMV
jgi:hypothetical protein